MLISCPSCGKRISDRAPACPFCKTVPSAGSPAATVPPIVPVESAPSPVPVESAPPPVSVAATPPATLPKEGAPAPPTPVKPVPPADDPTATLPPSALPPEFLAVRARPSPAPPPFEEPPLPPETPPPVPPPATDKVALEAAEHFNAGRFEEALATVDRLLRTERRNGEALNTRAQALFKLGRREEAARAIVQAIEASPDSVPFWINKAVMEHEEDKAKQACRSAMDLVEIAQHIEMESPLVDQGRQMIAAFEATGAFPNARGYLGWLGLGCAAMRAGRAEDALEFFDRVINAASGNAVGFLWKGRALMQLGQMDEALVLFDAALEVDPNDPEIHLDRGIAFGRLGDPDRAVEAFDAAIALDPHHNASLLEKRKITG